MVPELPPPVAVWLTVEGGPYVEAAADELADGVSALAIGTRLRSELAPARAAAVTAAAATRLRAVDAGIPDAERLLLTRAALEQASHPAVAAHRAGRFAQAPLVIDLCTGAGVDAVAIGRRVDTVVAVDLDPSRALLARHNTRRCGVDAVVVVGDARRPPVQMSGLLHADPSRRRGERRARRLADYGPPVGDLLAATATAAGRGIVLSPAVAWDDPHLPDDAEVEFLQVGQDLVEAMMWLGDLRRPGVRATATLLPEGETRSVEGPGEPLPVGPIREWLVEVAPAAVRARIHDSIGTELGARRVARNRALLTTSRSPGSSPWWRAWRVEAVLPARQREVRRWLRDARPLPLEISTHGLDADPQRWWRELGSPPRGPDGRRLHLVRTDDGALCIATEPV